MLEITPYHKMSVRNKRFPNWIHYVFILINMFIVILSRKTLYLARLSDNIETNDIQERNYEIYDENIKSSTEELPLLETVPAENRNHIQRNYCLCGKGIPPPKNINESRKQAEYKAKKQEKRLQRRAKARSRNKRGISANETERELKDRIVNGYRVNGRPWMANIFEDIMGIVCGGALINSRYIL